MLCGYQGDSPALAQTEIGAVAVPGVYNKEGNGLTSGFECDCWSFATCLDELVSMMWADLTFCITCNDCSQTQEKAAQEKRKTQQFCTLHCTNIKLEGNGKF